MKISAGLVLLERPKVSIFCVVILVFWCCFAFGASEGEGLKVESLVEELKRLYGTDDEDYVIDRLVAEAEASRLEDIAQEMLGESYAGSWFDAERMALVAGATSDSQTEVLQRLGIHVIQMSHSLSALQELQDQVLVDLESAEIWGGLAHSLYIDFPSNQVVISSEPGAEEVIWGSLRANLEPNALRIEDSAGRDIPVASSVRGGDEYTNNNFTASEGYSFECSIGFSVNGGYLTAGHCGNVGHSVKGFNGVAQGFFSDSIVGGLSKKDRARVGTNSNWTPIPSVNGYSDGLISVPAKWAALKSYPLYSTVCRYGQASDVSNCGTITQSNVTVNTAHGVTGVPYTITGLKRTSACVKGGDSGGPFLSVAESQAQGITLTASLSACSSYPSILSNATFDPVAGPLVAFSSTMLTTHGATKPTLSNYRCPDWDNSGQGTYVCQIDHYNAQGQTGMQWSTNTGHSSQSVLLYGTCSSGQWVSVSFTLTNGYGNVQKNAGFSCPTGPIP